MKQKLRKLWKNENGASLIEAVLIYPLLFVFVLAMVDIAVYGVARLRVENITQDIVRKVAAEGGDHNPNATVLSDEESWSLVGTKELSNADGYCGLNIGRCIPDEKPSMDCTPTVTAVAGDIVSCTTYYPYMPISKAILSSSLGMGLDALFPSNGINITIENRSETGASLDG